jgi:hypothetical protein
MVQLKPEELIIFLKDHIEPLYDSAYGQGYRASAHLSDGTFLPCVIFRNPNAVVELAVKRFKDEQSGRSTFKSYTGNGYYDVVKSFVTKGNCVNDYDIASVEKSKFAFPSTLLKQITGETTMGWTGFAARMKDDKYVGFGTSFRWEFFNMPDEYSTDDIEEIINHSYVLETGELRSHREGPSTRPEEYKKAIVYRERPFFECYIENL